MKRTICLAAAMVFQLVGAATADIQEFRVELNPALATLRYEVPAIEGNELGCGQDPFVCDFGLELDMQLQLDGLDKAHATVDELVLHGRRTMSGHPLAIALFYLKWTNEAADELTTPAFIVEAGVEPDQTRLTANDPLGNDLVLEFDRAKLINMSGGLDYRSADGAKYSFFYAVPEPSAASLAIAATLGCGWYCVVRRRGAC